MSATEMTTSTASVSVSASASSFTRVLRSVLGVGIALLSSTAKPQEPRPTIEVGGHSGDVMAISRIPGSSEWFSTGLDSTLRRWNSKQDPALLQTRRFDPQYHASNENVAAWFGSLASAPDGTVALGLMGGESASYPMAVWLASKDPSAPIRPINLGTRRDGSNYFSYVVWSESAQAFVAGDGDGNLHLVSEDATNILTVPLPEVPKGSQCTFLGMSSDGASRVAFVYQLSSGPSQSFFVSSADVGPHSIQPWLSPQSLKTQPLSVAYAAGDCLVVLADKNKLEVWKVQTRKIEETVMKFSTPEQSCLCVAVSPDQSMIAFASDVGEIRVFPSSILSAKALPAPLFVHQPTSNTAIYALAFAGDNGSLAYGGKSGLFNLWELSSVTPPHDTRYIPNIAHLTWQNNETLSASDEVGSSAFSFDLGACTLSTTSAGPASDLSNADDKFSFMGTSASVIDSKDSKTITIKGGPIAGRSYNCKSDNILRDYAVVRNDVVAIATSGGLITLAPPLRQEDSTTPALRQFSHPRQTISTWR